MASPTAVGWNSKTPGKFYKSFATSDSIFTARAFPFPVRNSYGGGGLYHKHGWDGSNSHYKQTSRSCMYIWPWVTPILSIIKGAHNNIHDPLIIRVTLFKSEVQAMLCV